MPPPPHIVLVMADQLSARALPAYGNQVVRAPHLERLAGESVVFDRALCPSPLCVPSRSAMVTGTLPSRTGVYDNGAELPASVPTFAHYLRARGYRTVLVGKMHFIGPDQLHGFEERPMPDVYPAGFDWVPDWRLADDETLPWYHDLSSVQRAGPVRETLQIDYDAEVVGHAVRAIADSARRDDRPLLLVVSFTHPHDPYEVTAEHWDRYDGVEVDEPAFPDPPDPVDEPTRRLRAMVAADRIPLSRTQLLDARRGYYGAVSLVDDHVGSILEALDEQMLAGNTVAVFTSDHGDMLGERGLWYKMAPFEDSVRVPLFVRAPGRFSPRRVTEPVSLLDLHPTLVDLAGGFRDDEPAAPSDGVSLVGALEGDPAPERDVPLEYLAEGVRAPQVSLVRGSLKLVRDAGGDFVYDVDSDAGERTNVAGTPAADALAAAAEARWDLARLDEEVRGSQCARRLVAAALATGTLTAWDVPTDDPDGPYIRSGQDFWSRLERSRRV